jgi:flagellar basal body-associated protein FliL
MAAPASDKNEGSKPESSGGIKSMLPLILNIVLLPVIAFAMTQYVLLPRLNQSAVAPGAAQGDHGDEASQDDASHGSSGSHDSGHSAPAKSDSHGSDSKGHGASTDATHMLDAVTVNVAGTMGSRLLMAKIGIRGTNPKLPDLVKDRAQDLRDAASSLLQTKTLMDIERQGARNTIRAELKNAFARVIGQGSFSEVVIPDMAVQ